MYDNKLSFIVYSLSRRDAELRGTKQARQRFHQCISTIEEVMRPAMEALAAQKYFDVNTKRAATELVKEAVADVITEIKKAEELNENEDVRKKIIQKLENLNLSVMYQDEILIQQKIENIYEELSIDGSEPLLDMLIAMSKHHQKLMVESNSGWMKRVEKFTQSFRITYFLDENALSKTKF